MSHVSCPMRHANRADLNMSGFATNACRAAARRLDTSSRRQGERGR